MSSPEMIPVAANVDDDLRTDKQAAFVREYPKDFNATAAAKRAGYSEATAGQIGHALLKKVEIQVAVERRAAEIAAVAEVDAAMVVRELLDVATADVRELVSIYRDACRYCYGIDHRRQWTRGEYESLLTDALAAGKSAPDLAGGFGYDATREPHPDCPECHGRGVECLIATDTRKLSSKAAKLYAGAQQTKDGIKALARNQNEALMALGRYLVMFKERTEVSGPGGGPVPLLGLRPEDLSDEQLTAIAAAGALEPTLTP